MQHRHEQSDGARQTGSYGYVDANGIFRKVYYIADENGFRVKMDSNEPGFKDAPLGDAISKQSSESSYSAQSPPVGAASGTADEQAKAVSAAVPAAGQDWIDRDLQRVRSEPAPFTHNRPMVSVPDSRLPVQYASNPLSSSASSSPLSSSPKTLSSSSSYPVHFLTSNLPAYSSGSAQHSSSSASIPKYSDSPPSSTESSHARHRPQYDHSPLASSDPASSHPPHAYPSAVPHSSAGYSAPIGSNVNSAPLYVRETPLSGHLTNRPSLSQSSARAAEAYPPYEYQYQLPNRSPAVHSVPAMFGAPNEYAPPLPSPKPQEPYASPTYPTDSSNYRLHPTMPRKHRLLADSGLISVHGLDEPQSYSKPINHSAYYTPQPSYSDIASGPIDRPSHSGYAAEPSLPARPQIDYERYRQLIRSKLPARNIPYRAQSYGLPANPLSARPSPMYNRYNLTDRPSPTDHISPAAPSYDVHPTAGDGDSTDPNAPLFMSRYSNRDPISSKHYYDRFKQAEFASFRPPSSTAHSDSTSGRSVDHKPSNDVYSNAPLETYRPQSVNTYDPHSRPTYSGPAPALSPSSAPQSPSTVPLSYHTSGRASAAPHYDRPISPHSYSPPSSSSSHYLATTPAPVSGYTAPPYTYSLAPPAAVTQPTPPASGSYDNDLYNPQGAVQLSIKKRIANRHRNQPFAGQVYMNWPAVASASRTSGYIRAHPNATSASPALDPTSMYRYEASNQKPTFNQFKSGLKQLLPLLGSESSPQSNATRVSLLRNSRNVARSRDSSPSMPFDRSDVITYQSELPMSSSNFRLSSASSPAPSFQAQMSFTNGSEPQASASDSVSDMIELVRTSSLVKAIPLGRVQMSNLELTSKKA